MVMPDVVLGQLKRHKVRTGLTILGIAIGILLVTTLSSFSEGISVTVNTQLTLLSGKVTVTSEGIGFAGFQASELDEELIGEFEQLDGVDRVGPLIAGNVPGVGDVFAINIADLDMFDLRPEMTEGRFFEDGEDEVVIGIAYADRTGLKVADEIEIRGKRYEIVGEMVETGTEEDRGVLTSIGPAQEMLKKEGKVTIIIIKPSDVSDVEDIAREINENYEDVQAVTDKDAAASAAEFTGQLSFLTFAVGSIAAIIAGLGIANVMFMSVRERRKEIGTMKALGASTREVLSQVLMEAVVITLIGEAIGLLLSFGIVAGLNEFMGGGTAKITLSLVINVTIFALSLAIISGLLPAREASRLQPAVVLRYE